MAAKGWDVEAGSISARTIKARTVTARTITARTVEAGAAATPRAPPLIAHVLLFRLRDDLSSADEHALVEAYAAALRDIPSIRRAHVGRRIFVGGSYEAAMRTDYPYAAILEFDDAAGVRAYLDHPAHAEIGTRFAGASAERLVYDFELLADAEALRRLLT